MAESGDMAPKTPQPLKIAPKEIKLPTRKEAIGSLYALKHLPKMYNLKEYKIKDLPAAPSILTMTWFSW